MWHRGLLIVHRRVPHEILLPFIVSSRVGIVVDPRIAGQLIGSRESLCAPGVMATVGLFASMCPNVSCLMLEPVECFLAEGALVRAREVWSYFVGRAIVYGRDLHCRHGGGHTRVSSMSDSVR